MPDDALFAEVVRKVGRGKYSEVFEGIQVTTGNKVRIESRSQEKNSSGCPPPLAISSARKIPLAPLPCDVGNPEIAS